MVNFYTCLLRLTPDVRFRPGICPRQTVNVTPECCTKQQQNSVSTTMTHSNIQRKKKKVLLHREYHEIFMNLLDGCKIFGFSNVFLDRYYVEVHRY